MTAPYDRRASDEPRVPKATEARAMTPPALTEREFAVLSAFRRFGSWKQAAHACGITTGAAKQRAGIAYRRLGVDGWNEAFRKLGWLA